MCLIDEYRDRKRAGAFFASNKYFRTGYTKTFSNVVVVCAFVCSISGLEVATKCLDRAVKKLHIPFRTICLVCLFLGKIHQRLFCNKL